MHRFRLEIRCIDYLGNDFGWDIYRSYKTERRAKQGLNDLKKILIDRKWRLIDSSDNGVSFY